MTGRIRMFFAALSVLWLMFKSATGIGEAPNLDTESVTVERINGRLICIGENRKSQLIDEGRLERVEHDDGTVTYRRTE